jgi:hypothetical protein
MKHYLEKIVMEHRLIFRTPSSGGRLESVGSAPNTPTSEPPSSQESTDQTPQSPEQTPVTPEERAEARRFARGAERLSEAGADAPPTAGERLRQSGEEFARRGREQIEKLERWKTVGTVAGAVVAGYVGYRLFRSLFSSNEEASDSAQRQRRGTLRRILPLLGGVGVAFGAYRLISGAMGTESLFGRERREREPGQEESPSETRQRERYHHPTWGEMLPAGEKLKLLRGDVTEIGKEKMSEIDITVRRNFAAYSLFGVLAMNVGAVRSFALGATAWTAKKVSDVGRNLLKLGSWGGRRIAKNPILASLGVAGGVFTVSAIIEYIKSKEGHLPAKNENLAPYLKNYVENNAEELRAAGINIPRAEQIDEAVQYVTDPTSFRKLLEDINLGIVNGLDALGDALHYEDHMRPRIDSLEYLGDFKRQIEHKKRYHPKYREILEDIDGTDAKFNVFYEQLEKIKELIRNHESDDNNVLPRELSAEMEKLKQIGEDLMINIVERADGKYLEWSLLDPETMLPLSDPQLLLVNPSLDNQAQINANEQFRYERGDSSVSVVLEEGREGLRRVGGRILTPEVREAWERSLLSGAAHLVFQSGRVFFEEAGKVVFSGPIELAGNLFGTLTGSATAGNVMTSYGAGLIPATVLFFGSNTKFLNKFVLGGPLTTGQILIKIGTWPVSAPAAFFRTIKSGTSVPGVRGMAMHGRAMGKGQLLESLKAGRTSTKLLQIQSRLQGRLRYVRSYVDSVGTMGTGAVISRSQILDSHRRIQVYLEARNALHEVQRGTFGAKRKLARIEDMYTRIDRLSGDSTLKRLSTDLAEINIRSGADNSEVLKTAIEKIDQYLESDFNFSQNLVREARLEASKSHSNKASDLIRRANKPGISSSGKQNLLREAQSELRKANRASGDRRFEGIDVNNPRARRQISERIVQIDENLARMREYSPHVVRSSETRVSGVDATPSSRPADASEAIGSREATLRDTIERSRSVQDNVHRGKSIENQLNRNTQRYERRRVNELRRARASTPQGRQALQDLDRRFLLRTERLMTEKAHIIDFLRVKDPSALRASNLTIDNRWVRGMQNRRVLSPRVEIPPTARTRGQRVGRALGFAAPFILVAAAIGISSLLSRGGSTLDQGELLEILREAEEEGVQES